MSGSLAVILMALQNLPAILSVRLGWAEESPGLECQQSLLMLHDSGQTSLKRQSKIQNAVVAHRLVPHPLYYAVSSVLGEQHAQCSEDTHQQQFACMSLTIALLATPSHSFSACM